MKIDEAEFEAKLEVTLDQAEEWWENLEPEVKATIFINKDEKQKDIQIINELDEQVKTLKQKIKEGQKYHKEQIDAIQKKIGKDVSEL